MDQIAEVKKAMGDFPIISNGNVITPEDVTANLDTTGCDGVMYAFHFPHVSLVCGRQFCTRVGAIGTTLPSPPMCTDGSVIHEPRHAWLRAHLLRVPIAFLHHSIAGRRRAS